MPDREKLALLPLLVAQAILTRRRAPTLGEADGPREGWVGCPTAASPQVPEAVRLLIVGDSSAAGVGVGHQDRALAGYLTRTVAARTNKPVHWQLKAKSGVTTQQALRLVQRDPPKPADIAVAVLGVNDVIEQVTPRRAVMHRERLADWLLDEVGVQHVVFSPLPPVHELPLLPQPLRRIAGEDARRHDEAMATWAAGRTDVSHVPIAMTLNAAVLAEDGFHPGEPVYRLCGEALGRFIAGELLTEGMAAGSRASPGPSSMGGRETITPPYTVRRHPHGRSPSPVGGQDLVHHRRLAGHWSGDRQTRGS
jgi:lysophospholipase L1-like esterase